MSMISSMIFFTLGCWTPQQSSIPIKQVQQNIPVLYEFQEVTTVFTSEDEDPEESAKMHVVVRAGYAHDPIGKEGLSKITSEILRQGGKVQQRKRWLERCHNIDVEEVEAYVGPELVRFTMQSSIQDLHLVGSIFEQMFGGSFWREGSLTKAKEDLKKNINISHQIQGHRESLLGWGIFYNWIFEGHPYGHHPSGRMSSIESITMTDVRTFFLQRYIREASRIGVSLMMSNPQKKSPEELIEKIAKNEEITEVQHTLSDIFAPVFYNNVTPKRLQSYGQTKPFFLEMKVQQEVPHNFESQFYMGQSIDISPQDDDFLAMLLAIFIVNDAPQVSGNIAFVNQSQDHRKGTMVLGVQADRIGESFSEIVQFDAIQQALVWVLPGDFKGKEISTEFVETYIHNWEKLISVGVSKEEFLVYRNQLTQHIQQADAHQRLQWRLQLDALGEGVSLDTLALNIQKTQYKDVNDAIQRHISKKKMKSMLLIAPNLGKVKQDENNIGEYIEEETSVNVDLVQDDLFNFNMNDIEEEPLKAFRDQVLGDL
jgi:hypothetical protein